MLRDERGLTYATTFAVIVSLLMAFYTVYNAVGLPAVYKKEEQKFLSEIIEDARKMLATQYEVVARNTPMASPIRMTYQYSPIPFFPSPPPATVGLSLYDIRVTISGIQSSPNIVNIPSQVILSGKGLAITPSLTFTPTAPLFVEAGVVASGNALMDSSLVSRGGINILLFDSSAYSSTIYPRSGGGDGVIVEGAPTIRIDGTKIPREAWMQLHDPSRGITVNYQNGSVTITLPNGTYKLFAGLAAFQESGSLPANYVYVEPSAVKTGSVVRVEALDVFFNPVPANVSVRPIQGSPQLCTTNATGLSCYTLAGQRTLLSPTSLYVESNTGVSLAVFSVTRPDGSTYQMALLVSPN